ncbi:MAG: hypothetical protein ACRDL7_15965 [Gaiellaceae bacterium]
MSPKRDRFGSSCIFFSSCCSHKLAMSSFAQESIIAFGSVNNLNGDVSNGTSSLSDANSAKEDDYEVQVPYDYLALAQDIIADDDSDEIHVVVIAAASVPGCNPRQDIVLRKRRTMEKMFKELGS